MRLHRPDTGTGVCVNGGVGYSFSINSVSPASRGLEIAVRLPWQVGDLNKTGPAPDHLMPRLDSKLFSRALSAHGIKYIDAQLYIPRTDGQVERSMQAIL